MPKHVTYFPILILLFGCAFLTNTPTATLPRPTSTSVPPSPTILVPTPTVRPTSTTAPQTISTPVVAIPTIDFDDLLPYQQAMLPQFTNDVVQVAQAGASQYFINLTIDPNSFTKANDFIYTGQQQVHYTNTEETSLSEIYFRLYPNFYGGQIDIETVTINNQKVTPALEANNTALHIPLSPPLRPDDTLDLALTYTVSVPTNGHQGYNIFSYVDKTAALASFYPVIAVYDEQGWNIDIPVPYGDATYLDTSLYQVQLTLPQDMVVTASGSLLDSTKNDDGTQTLHLVSGPIRDFYLAIRRDFQVVSQVVDGTVVNSYYPPDLEDGAKNALTYASDALHIFNERFGPYPYAELDVVATPTTAGGVEYPGIVVVSERLYNQTGGFFQHATAHEVAHQWWYSLVGNDQVNEPWLDEALTNYSTVIYWEEIEGQESANFILTNFMQIPYEAAKEKGEDKAVIGPVAGFTVNEYSIFVYSKGPLFFNTLRQELGDNTYFEIMQRYYTTYKYNIAQADDLFETIEAVSKQSVKPLRQIWLE